MNIFSTPSEDDRNRGNLLNRKNYPPPINLIQGKDVGCSVIALQLFVY